MKKANPILTAFFALALTACSVSEQDIVSQNRNRVGYSAWHTQVSYTHCEPLPKTGMPEFVRGRWEMVDGILRHTACEEAPLAICNYVIESDHYTIHCTARKDDGPEGFIIVFNYADSNNYYRIHFGAANNSQHTIEQISGDSLTLVATCPGSIETGEWYNVQLTVAGDTVRVWLNDAQMFDDLLKRNTSLESN